MIEFKKYEGGTAELTDLGTVKSVAGKGGKMALIRKNWNDTTKRVALLITRKDGQSAVVPCSKQVSDALRAKKLTAAQLAGLTIVETEVDGEARQFVSIPATGAIHELSLDNVKTEEVELTAQSMEELIAL